MNSRGSALLSAIWLSIMLAGLAAVMLDLARTGLAVSHWRLHDQREAWAAEACLAIMLARSDSTPRATTGTVQIGTRLWCRGALTPAGSLVDLAHAPSWALVAALSRPELVASLLDWQDADSDPRVGGAERDWYLSRKRPSPRNARLANLAELALIRGFDDTVIARIRAIATVRLQPAPLALGELPIEVLEGAPWLSWEALALLRSHRRPGTLPSSIEALASDLSPYASEPLLAESASGTVSAQLQSDELIFEVAAGVAPDSLNIQMGGTARVRDGMLRLVEVQRR